MRLLFLTNLYPPHSIGGYEEVCRDMAEGLRSRGHDVSVLTSSYRTSFEADDSASLRLLRVQRDWLHSSNRAISGRFFGRVRADRHNALVMKRVMSAIKPDVVVYWNGSNLGRGLLSAADGHPAVVWYLEDNWLGSVLTEGDRRLTVRAVVKYATLKLIGVPVRNLGTPRLVFCSRALMEEYRERNVDLGDARVIPNGISTDIFPYRGTGKQRSSREPVRLLYVGRLCPEKGITTLVQALARLRALPGFDQTMLSLVGIVQGQAFEGVLRKQIAVLDLEDAVHFKGQLHRKELANVYKEHDVAVFPSEWREPFGLTLLEAMAVGLPVVSSVLGGPAEIVRNYENAVAFRAGDPDDLADKLVWVLQHPAEAAAMGLRASQDVRQRFRLESQLDRLEEYLQSILAGDRQPQQLAEVMASN